MSEVNVSSIAYDVSLVVEQLRRAVHPSGEQARQRLHDALREIRDNDLVYEALLVAICGLAKMTDDDPDRLTSALDLTADRMLDVVP